jgi:hypothetical protein
MNNVCSWYRNLAQEHSGLADEIGYELKPDVLRKSKIISNLFREMELALLIERNGALKWVGVEKQTFITELQISFEMNNVCSWFRNLAQEPSGLADEIGYELKPDVLRKSKIISNLFRELKLVYHFSQWRPWRTTYTHL